ncbi:TauD/TfdA family dioxygenase [Kineosporia sp. J2-2]|uniref:TauD/TfdA family dioxygenase n=1 Tax=Kineosporia corallincola TaxID=2835133 RepID=A0ABS5TTX8_9ACTN|nr:TauD/TfdA family dioxygenase [Kineosporia corallincola]MBT0774230.1 TauD/TfdA family dioxygenase [Kineosporia corallincola]
MIEHILDHRDGEVSDCPSMSHVITGCHILRGNMRFTTFHGDAMNDDQFWHVLESDGIVFIQEGTQRGLSEFLQSFTTWYHHPHEHSAGLTKISPNSLSNSAGSAGFTHLALGLHTDRSTASEPPSILASVMEHASTQGGDSIFCDGQKILKNLKQKGHTEQDIADLRLVGQFGETPMWGQPGKNHYSLRYRDDEVARPATSSREDTLSDLHLLLGRLMMMRHLEQGEGYVLHNHRILHGRTAFKGARSVIRILANVLDSSQHRDLNQGFVLPED